MLKEILLLNPIYVTIFWAIALFFHNRSSHLPKVFLGWFMVAASLVYISHFFYFTKNFQVYIYFDSIYTLAYLLVYPLYHIYVRLLTVDSSVTIKKHGKFLIAPFVVFFLVLTGYLTLGKEQGMSFITNILVQGDKPHGAQLYMHILFVLGRIVFLLQTAIYLYLSFRLIKENNLRLQDYYSNMEFRKLNWVQFFNFCFAFTSLSSAILATLGRNFFLKSELFLAFPSVVFTLMLFFIGLLGYRQKEVFTEIARTPDAHAEGKPPLHLKAKLDHLFEKELIYKNPDLKIWDVCSILGTNRTYVSKIINSEYSRNFCTHVNHYRISYAKSLISNNKNLTNEQVAELSGFGSVNSMYRAFQSTENISLGQYRKKTEVS